MSDNIHLAPGVDTTLLKTLFSVVTDAVGALRFPVKSNKFPPTVNLVRSLSYFSGFNSHTILPYVTFLSFGGCVFEMKITAFVPFTFLIPWDNCPKSFAKYRSHFFLSGPSTRCLYSWATPDFWWVTALASLTCSNCVSNANFGKRLFLRLDLKLELLHPVSTLGVCAVRTLGGGTGTSGGVICGPEGDIWILCWKYAGLFPSSSSMMLGRF